MSKIYKHEIPADGEWHTVPMSGDVLHVGSQQPNKVHLWALHSDDGDRMVGFCVISTGKEVPAGAKHVGTTTDAGGYFVWHLFTRE